MTTKGENRVRTEFNPSKDGVVDQIKQQSAKLIDLCEEVSQGEVGAEAARCLAIAQTKYEEATMWAVKGATA